jgi:hypothetical protein
MKRAFSALAILLPLVAVACAAVDDHEGRHHRRNHDDSVTSYAPSESAPVASPTSASDRTAATPYVGENDSGTPVDVDAADAAVPEEPAEAGAE